MKKHLLGLLPCAFFSVSAMAQVGYVGVESSVVVVDYSATYSETYSGYTDIYDTQDDDFATALKVTAGGMFSPYFALEGFVGVGVQKAMVDDGYFTLDVELDKIYGANAVGLIPLGRVVSLYGKVGVASIEYVDEDDDNYEETGASYGFGMKFNTGSFGAVIVDYAIYPDAELHLSEDYGMGDGAEYNATIETRIFSVGYHFNL